MLPASKRLPRTLFEKTFSLGVRMNTPHFHIRALLATPETRWAVVIPKKHIRFATKRNALQRKIYTALASMPTQPIRTGYYIIMLTKKIDPATFSPHDELAQIFLGAS